MTSPPQWAPDPHQPGQLRWWDGVRWTEHTTPAAPPQGPYAGGPPQAPYLSPYGQYGSPAQGGWTVPSGAGQWGAPPGVYYQTKKRGKRFWWSFGVIATVAVLVAGSVFGVVIYKVIQDVRAPERAAEAYLGDLTDGRYSDAYAKLCSEDVSAVSLSRFIASKTAHHPLSYRVSGAAITTTNGVKTARVDFNETTSDGRGSSSSQLTLESTPTGWRVCHFGLDPDQWASVPTGQQTGPGLSTAWAQPPGVTRRGLSG